MVVTGSAVLALGPAWSTDRLTFTLRTDGEVALSTTTGPSSSRATTAT